MRIAMINGSPKLGESNSGFMLKALGTFISTGHEITHYNINKKPLTNEQYKVLCSMDALVFAFPLYIDAVPSHLLRMLISLENHLKDIPANKISVYVLVNNGFYEGEQNHIAIEIMKNWCERCKLRFGQGIGQGAGEMLGSMQNVPLGHGPLKNLGKAMESCANIIMEQSSGETTLFSPNFPYFAWHFSADAFWHSQAKKNGLKRRDIVKKVEVL